MFSKNKRGLSAPHSPSAALPVSQLLLRFCCTGRMWWRACGSRQPWFHILELRVSVPNVKISRLQSYFALQWDSIVGVKKINFPSPVLWFYRVLRLEYLDFQDGRNPSHLSFPYFKDRNKEVGSMELTQGLNTTKKVTMWRNTNTVQPPHTFKGDPS